MKPPEQRAPIAACPDCGIERTDYEGPNAHLPTCPNCQSTRAPGDERERLAGALRELVDCAGRGGYGFLPGRFHDALNSARAVLREYDAARAPESPKEATQP